MKISSDIKPIAYLQARTVDLLRQINETRRPVIITQNGKARAVLQDPKSYEDMREAIAILKLISRGEADIRNGRIKEQAVVFEELEAMLAEKGA
jgi:prevent-host-death family protein